MFDGAVTGGPVAVGRLHSAVADLGLLWLYACHWLQSRGVQLGATLYVHS